MSGKQIIITADDFGISQEINEAVEIAHTQGILSATSLMVGEAFAEDAARRAKLMPSLGVGLHLALTRGKSVLDPKKIPDLVDASGRFKDNLFMCGLRFFFNSKVHLQLAAEINAQFKAFQNFELKLDHVNVHNHMHMHPTVLDLILNIGGNFGMRAMRLPKTPHAPIYLKPWMLHIKNKLNDNNIHHNDVLMGLSETGKMNSTTMQQCLKNLSSGVTEIMCHPATGPWAGLDTHAKHFNFDKELAALIHPDVKTALKNTKAKVIRFGDLK